MNEEKHSPAQTICVGHWRLSFNADVNNADFHVSHSSASQVIMVSEDIALDDREFAQRFTAEKIEQEHRSHPDALPGIARSAGLNINGFNVHACTDEDDHLSVFITSQSEGLRASELVSASIEGRRGLVFWS